MKKTAAQQVTFRGGMIEGVKQDVPYEQGNGMLQSVLWLENYNHTLQEDSAIKRWGEVDSGVPYLDFGLYSPNRTNDYYVNGTAYTENDRASQLQGMQLYSVVHPEYNNNYTAFVQRYPNTSTAASYDYIPQWIIDEGLLQQGEATALISYTIAKDGDSPAWQEVWADGNLDYPGWYAFGTLSDVTRYGETLLFTTTMEYSPYFDSDGVKNPVNDYLYPVYRYLYWDIRKKWKSDNQFLNGIDAYDEAELDDVANASKFAKWKILSPSQSLLNSLEIDLVWGVEDGVDSSYTSPGGTTISGVDNDISVIVQECVQYAYKKVLTTAPTETISSRYYPSWGTDNLSVQLCDGINGYDYKEVLSPTASVTSWEVPNLSEFMFEAWGTPDDNGTFMPSGNAYYGISDIGYFTNKPYQTFGKTGTPIDIIFGENLTKTGLEYWEYGITKTKLEKYTETRMPRMFLYGEKFDLILTANINGIEVLLWRGFHQIRTEPYDIKGQASLFAGVMPYMASLEDPGDLTINVDGAQKATYGSSDLYYQAKTETDGFMYVYYGSTLYFSIEVKKSVMEKFVDVSASSISLWCAKPDSNRHILKSVGSTFETPSGNIYNKPVEQGTEAVDYTKYALLKKFVIDGRTEAPLNYENWLGLPYPTNSWTVRTDASANEWYTAVPLNQREDSTGTPMSLPLYPTSTNIRSYLDGDSTMFDVAYWTPDFIVWDYPTETTLFLNSSGKYWKGLGAKLITVIKGRTFIGGCIGADGIEEQAILRYSDVQGGAISPDIFSEERKIQVGHIPHTALLEFREQLWAFSRYQFYRIGLASITQEETWEFFDVVEQGCFNNKTVVVVPYGVCFCNEAGVWLSEGGEPTNLALPVLPTYQHISSGTEYLYTTINQLDGVPYIGEKAVNPYLELNYDSFNDEILVSTPLFEDDTYTKAVTDFTMIYSFKYKTWRIESSTVPTVTQGITP